MWPLMEPTTFMYPATAPRTAPPHLHHKHGRPAFVSLRSQSRASLKLIGLNAPHANVEFDAMWKNEDFIPTGRVVTYSYIDARCRSSTCEVCRNESSLCRNEPSKPREPRIRHVHEQACDCAACELWRDERARKLQRRR
jgi:hypothetical protein